MSTVLNTKEKIIELGRDFVQTFGYHSFKYQQIATELNIKNAAIHHYFPSKEDLGLAIIEKDHSDFLEAIKGAARKKPSARVEMILGAYTSYFQSGKNLCVVGACGSAYLDTPKSMQLASKKYLDDIVNWLIQIFKEQQENGELNLNSTPEELANFWIATLTGSIKLSQINGAAYFKQVLNQLRKSFSS